MFHPLIMQHARAQAVAQLMSERKLSRRAAREAVDGVSDADVNEGLASVGVTADGSPGESADPGPTPSPPPPPGPVIGFIQQILAWIKANPQVIQTIVQIILTLIPLVA